VSGHNLKQLPRTEQHRKRIGEAQRRAWQTTRQRKPIGSRMIDGDGYARIKVVAGTGRWRPEHFIVAERSLGRALSKGEVVHHIDGDRANNEPQNLFVCRDRSHHNEVHRSEAAALRLLLAKGIVVFRDGRYEALLPG
jgi:hypothetical protein